MKTTSLLFFLVTSVFLAILSHEAQAQENLEVTMIQAEMSQGLQPCYVVQIPKGVLKEVQQNWVRKIQEGLKTKVATVNNELILKAVVKPEITSDTISIYTLLIQNEGRVVMNVFLEIDSVFFSPKEEKTHLSSAKVDNAIRTYLRNFAIDQYRLIAAKEAEAEEALLEQMEEEYAKIGKENENLEKDISRMENDIEKTEREITDLEGKIELKNQELIKHATSMQGLVLEEEKKLAKSIHKDLEKEKKKLEKERTNAKNDISDMKSTISQNKKTIEKNIELQEQKQIEIDWQKEEVRAAQALLEGIK